MEWEGRVHVPERRGATQPATTRDWREDHGVGVASYKRCSRRSTGSARRSSRWGRCAGCRGEGHSWTALPPRGPDEAQVTGREHLGTDPDLQMGSACVDGPEDGVGHDRPHHPPQTKDPHRQEHS